MTGNLDRYGEPIEDDDIAPVPPNESNQNVGNVLIPPRTRDEIHHERCAELRRILKDARDRREAQP